MENRFKAQVIVEPVSVWLLELISQMKGKTPLQTLTKKKKTSLQFSIDNCSQESRAGSKTSFYNRFLEWRKFLKKKNNDSFDQSLHFAVNRSFKLRLFYFGWVVLSTKATHGWKIEGIRVLFFFQNHCWTKISRGTHFLCFIVFLPKVF